MAIYYNQADTRWANHPYTSPTHPQANLRSSGCGPTSGAMVISSLVKLVLPNAMADLFKNNGFRANEGTSLEAFNWLAKNYNLTLSKSTKLDDAVNCLHRGGMVICSLSEGGLFSTGGHIIVFAKMKDANTIVVYDPYLYNGKFNQLGRQGKVTVNGNEIYCSMYNFQTYAKCQAYFCYEKPIAKPDLECNAHIQDIGWTGYKDASKEMIGTEGQGKRLEAIQFKANNGVDIKYKVHIEELGWTDWKNNGEIAGTTGQAKRIEAIEIECNKCLEIQEHIQDVGWMPKSKGTKIHIGTEGKALRLEAFKINII